MKKSLLSIFVLAVLMVVSTFGYAQTTYTKITSASGLEAGAQYIIVGYDEALGFCAMSYQKTNNRHAVNVDENGGSITAVIATDPNNQTDVFQFTLGGSNGAWTFFDELKNGYLYAASSSGNQLKTQTTLDANGQWAIEFDADGYAVVTAQGENTRNIMRFNENSSNGTPLFSCYNSGSSINVPVMLYKAGGGAQPEPEPSNYPTNFNALVAGVDITLNWTDATGTQLPHKYLVVGANADLPITVPTDGVPVPNDYLVANVNYGAQSVTFAGLEGGLSYHFAIFPYTNSGSNIDYKTDGNYPTASATTDNIFILLDENFDNELGDFTAYSVTGEQTWHQATYNGVTYANMNGYANGGYNENEDWLISPVMVVGDNEFEALSIEFRTAMKFDGNPLEVYISNDYDGAGAPDDYVWTNITNNFQYSTGNYEWVLSGAYMMTHPTAGNYYLAFKYTSTDAAASSWEIDWVKVTGVQTVSVNEQAAQTVSVYPNPAHEMVSFNLEGNAQVSVFDMTGRLVSDMNMTAGVGQLQIANLENGVYFLNVRYDNGKQEVTRFVKY